MWPAGRIDGSTKSARLRRTVPIGAAYSYCQKWGALAPAPARPIPWPSMPPGRPCPAGPLATNDRFHSAPRRWQTELPYAGNAAAGSAGAGVVRGQLLR